MNLDTYYKNLTRMLFMATLMLGIGLNAQNAFLISFPSAPENLTVCYGSSKLTVQLDATIASTTGGDVTIQLAMGVNYVPGSVAMVSNIGGLSIIENGGTPNVPKFKINPSTLAPGNRIVFTIDRTATCAARNFALASGIFTDNVNVSIGAQSDTKSSSSYLVNYPDITFTQPATQTNAVVGGTYTRTFKFKNGGIGCLNQIYLSLDNPSNGIQQISLQVTAQNGLAITPITITPTSISGSTTYYTIPSLVLPGGDLCNSEEITITETYKVRVCNAVTNYSVGWGCDSTPANWCVTSTGIGSISMATGVANYSKMELTNLNYTSNCNPWDVRLRMYNEGTGNASAAAMFNTKIRLGFNYFDSITNGYNNTSTAAYTITNIRIGSVTATVVITGTGVNKTINIDCSQFTSDPDGAGIGFDDLDGDGQYDDLVSGNYVDLIFTYAFNCTTSCGSGASIPYHGPVVALDYNTMCGTFISGIDRRSTSATTNYFGMFNYASAAVFPPQVGDAVPFNITFGAVTQGYTLPGQTSNTRWVWTVTLPVGVTIVGTPTWTTTSSSGPITYTQSGQTLTFVSPTSTYVNINANFVYTCGTSGNKTFQYNLTRYDDYSTGCSCRGNIFCGTFNIEAKCADGTCPGVFTTQPDVRRTLDSYGFANNSLTTKVNPNTLASVQLKRALYLHKLQIKGKGIQKGISSNNLHLELQIAKTAAGVAMLTPVSADVTITRAGSVINTCTLTSSAFDASASTSTRSIYQLDLTSCLPGSSILIDDEVEVTAIYKVSAITGLGNTLDAEDALWKFYNLDSGGNQLFCSTWIPEMYLFDTSYISTINEPSVSSCDLVNGGSYFRRLWNNTLNLFPGERIPWAYINYIEYDLPTGYTFDSAILDYNNFAVPDKIITPTSISGNTYRFVNDGTWEPIFENAQGSAVPVLIRMNIRPTCATIDITRPKNALRLNYYDYYYGFDVTPLGTVPNNPGTFLTTATPTSNMLIDYQETSRPAVTLSNQSGTIQASKPTESAVVRLASTGTTTAPFTWIAIPTTTGVNITQIVDVATNTPLAVIPYSGGVWAQISTTGLLSGTYKDYRIDFTYTTCILTNFPVIGGWNCGAFPNNPTAYPCGIATTNLTFDPQSSSIQVNTITQPTTNITLCTPLNYEFRVNCAGAGNTINNKLNIRIPNGLTMVTGSLLVEYPVGAGNWQTVPVTSTITSTGIMLIVSLTSHTAYPAQGLPGTLNDGGNALLRQIGIKFSLITDCSFTSGSYVIVSTDAYNTCGKTATGSGSVLNINTLNVAGADPGYAINSTITNPNEPIIGCAGNLTINIKQIVVLSTASGTPITATVTVNYPPGYDLSNTTPNCLTSSFCPTLISTGVDLTTGLGYATYSIPNGMTTGQFMEYQLTFQPNTKITNGTYQAIVTTDDVINGLSCSSAPGGVCNSVKTRTSIGIYDYTLQCYCYKTAITSGTALDTKHGITSLGRAGIARGNWPMVRKGAWTALEAKTKGLVVNRLTDTQIAAIPSTELVEGMMVYNVTQDCLQINIDGTNTGWKCFNTQTCPDY